MRRVGVLALQGDVREHLQILESLGADALEVKHPEQLGEIDALIIPEVSPPRSARWQSGSASSSPCGRQ